VNVAVFQVNVAVATIVQDEFFNTALVASTAVTLFIETSNTFFEGMIFIHFNCVCQELQLHIETQCSSCIELHNHI
jgi:hypothetical protein